MESGDAGNRLWISQRRFRELVGEALDGIPRRIRETIANVEVVVEDAPDERILREMGYDPASDTLLGLYEGLPVEERVGNPPVLPDRIVIYYRPLAEMHHDEYHLRREIRRTVIHEIGHHFGFDDRHLHGRGF